MSFQEYSKSIVRDFLGSVAFIDDRIFSSKPVIVETLPTKDQEIASPTPISSKVPTENPTIPVTERIAVTPRAHVPATKDELESTDRSKETVIKTEDMDIDPKKFMSAFTKEGIHCSLCEYDEADLELYKALLQKSDVAILDWNMNSGKPEGTEASLLIGDLLAIDKESSLRLIVIYSSTPKPQWNEILIKRIKPLFGDRETTLTDFSIISGHTKIVFVYKGDPIILPARLIDEFVEMTSGLVSNTALKAITLIRDNTNKILGSYHKELDPAYLSNRIHLVNNKLSPELSEDLIRDMIMGSIFDLIHSSQLKEACDLSKIDIWLDEKDKFKQNRVQVKDTHLDLEKTERLCWLNLGFDEFHNQIIERSGVKKNPDFKDKKSIRANPTPYFTPIGNLLEKPNEEFAILSHQKANFLGKEIKPILTLGVVIKYQEEISNPQEPDNVIRKDHYMLSVQQPCDSLRLDKDEARSYIFLELKEDPGNKETKIIIKESGEYRKFAPMLNSHFLKTFMFKETNDGVVQAVNQKFTSIAGVEFEWLCDLKSNHAQRIINEFSSYLSRVGLDEPEWLRNS